MDVRSILAGARLKVHQRHPYFTAMLYNLIPIEQKGLGTFAVDEGSRMFYDPELAARVGVDGTATIEVHEVQHVIRGHHERAEAMKPSVNAMYNAVADKLAHKYGINSLHELFNWSADVEINDDIISCGWRWPAGFEPLTAKQFGFASGKTMEYYVKAFLESCKDHETPEDFKRSSPDKQSKMPGAGGCCGGCAGNPDPVESKDGNARKLRRDEQDVLRRTVAAAIKEAARSSRGDIPGGWKVWAEERLKPAKVDWRRALAANVRHGINVVKGAQDYSYRRQSRRSAAVGMLWGSRAPILPSTVARQPRPCIAFDTSGSMDKSRLSAAVSEALGIIKTVGSSCPAFAVDAKVHDVSHIKNVDQMVAMLKGGGGTDMRVAIKHAAEAGYNMLVLITDCETPWPAKHEMPHGMHVIVCCVGSQRDAESVPRYVGNVVRVES